MSKKQEIVTKLSANNKGLKNALDTAQSDLKKLSKEAGKAEKAVNKALSAKGGQGDLASGMAKGVESAATQGLTKAMGIGGPAGTILSQGIKSLFSGGLSLALPGMGLALSGLAKNFGDGIKEKLDVVKGAESAGVDTELYQRMGKAAEKTGGKIDTLTSAYSKFSSVLEAAKSGNLDAIDALAKLGMQASDFSNDTSEAFMQAVQALGETTSQSAAAMAVFGTNTAEAQKAFHSLAEDASSMDGIISDEELSNAQRLSDAWEQVGDSIADAFSRLTSHISGATDAVTGFLADTLEGLAALIDMPTENGNVTSADITAAQEKLARQRAAQEAAKKARADEERRKRNEEADRKTAQYQDRQQREELRRKQQRDRVFEQYNLAGMSEQERRLYNRRKYSDDLVAQGFSLDEAERITQRLYDAQFRGKTASQANPERERERWKQDYMRRYGVSANVAEDAARKNYDYRQQEQSPRASQPAHSYAAPLPAPSPAPQQTAQMLGAILQAVQALQKNTYVVE